MTRLTGPLRASARRLQPLGLLEEGAEGKTLWHFGYRREVFGEPQPDAHRLCGIWRLTLERAKSAPPEVKVPWNAFEVVIRSEPHRIVVVSISAAGSETPFVQEVARDFLPIERSAVLPDSLERCLTERLGRFLTKVESLMSRQSDRGLPAPRRSRFVVRFPGEDPAMCRSVLAASLFFSAACSASTAR